jgi:hypothetical protein
MQRSMGKKLDSFDQKRDMAREEQQKDRMRDQE